MFVHDGLLQPALEPSDYTSPQVFERERTALFANAWHLVAVHAQLAVHGAYVSTDVLGVPVLLRNDNGTIHAFVNVCAHRHSLLESPGCGVRDALRCRYHGWEYGLDGGLQKLPDGRSFKGLKSHSARLRKLRAESLGPLVYVSLEEAGPSLIEWLGALAGELGPFYERPLRPLIVTSQVHAVNWKVVVENAVESYHVPMIHPQTFRYYREPALHDHELGDNFTRYADLEPWSTSRTGKALALFAKLVLRESDGQRFRHAHCFPNQLYYYGDLYCDASVVTPLGPESVRLTIYGFVVDDLKHRRLTEPLMRAFGLLLRKQLAHIREEDRSAWLAVQAGVAHARGRGVLSAREERVWAFQHWVSQRLAGGQPVMSEAPLSVAPARTTPR